MHLPTATTLLAAVSLATLAACGSSSTPSTSSSGSSGGGSGSTFCQQAQQVETAFTALGQSVSSGTTTPDVATVEQLLQQGAQALDGLDAQAPSEIATAFHHLRTVYDQAAQQAQGATSLDQLSSPLAALNDSSLQSDQTTVNNYMKNTCGITDAPSSAAGPT